MPADHAQRRARCVEQNAVERLPVPPSLRRPRIGGQGLGLQLATYQIFPYPVKTLRIDVEGNQLGKLRFALRDERRLAAGRRAGIEHPLTWLKTQRKRDALCAQI